MAMGPGGGRGLRSDINVTPLVDVVLVLLIIFMVVTPLLQRGKEVALPKASQTDSERAEIDPLVVSITADRRVWVEQAQVDDVRLVEAVSFALRTQVGRRVLLKGDEHLAVDDVRRVLQLLRGAGARSVALAVEEVRP
jgi:biopolymer transport protein TolR